MTLSLAIGLPQTDSSNVKRPRPTALKDNMHRLGRVGRFTPNPALPTDQPLRGRWRTTTNLYVGSYKFAAIPKLLYNKRNQN